LILPVYKNELRKVDRRDEIINANIRIGRQDFLEDGRIALFIGLWEPFEVPQGPEQNDQPLTLPRHIDNLLS
jgi:hypothetical protein